MAQNLPYAAGSFQSVATTFPTPFIVDPQSLSEIKRVLAPGGRLVVLMAAWITGQSLTDRALQKLFRATDEVPPEDQDISEFLAPYQEAGFHASLRFVEMPGSRLGVYHCHQTKNSRLKNKQSYYSCSERFCCKMKCMEIQIAVAKTNKYAVSESGDTLEVVERPNGGMSVVLADGQTSGRGAKAISTMVVRKVISLLAEGVRDGAAARAASDYLYTERYGKVSATLKSSADLQTGTMVITRNNPAAGLRRARRQN